MHKSLQIGLLYSIALSFDWVADLADEVVEQKGRLRIVLKDEKYSVQLLYRFEWRTVTFGPYSPYSVGVNEFYMEDIVMEEYNNCLKEGIGYVKRGI